ncbi:MAG: hypothetical protein HFF52_07285 [Lawsonibacter sp.]|nr:hypothetical protein [Lawsonibacter sp.]
MKHYKSYMDRQEISPAVHEKLLNLEPPKGRSGPSWVRYGALAACAALLIGVGVWKLAPAPVQKPVQSGSQLTLDSAGTSQDHPLQSDAAQSGTAHSRFVVNSPAEGGKLAFPMLPGINYQDITDWPQADACRVYMPGSFMVDLEKEDIQAVFWGPEGKPQTEHPKTEQGDLPWMLFWDGYALQGRALYDGQGQLMELTIWGEQGRASFDLEMRVGGLPFTCCIDLDRGDEISEFNGVSIAGWSQVYDRDGDGRDDYICGSEFMTKNDIGVRFVNRNSSMQSEYVPGGDMELGGAQTFNALFVRQALTGGLSLDHLKTAESVPAWREEEFSSLAQARQEADFAPYLPISEPAGYGANSGNKEFYGRYSYQEDTQNMLFVRWSRGYDNVEVCVYRDGYQSFNLVSPDQPETYDLSLYPIPWCDSVPKEHRETVNSPAFRAEDMSLEIVEARGREHDTGGLTYSFDVLHPDGTLVSYRCDGMTAQQVWALVEGTL